MTSVIHHGAGGEAMQTEVGEVTTTGLTPDEARHLTDEIKEQVEAAWAKLRPAYEGRAWAALGYPSWQLYVTSEFDVDWRHAIRLLDHARRVQQIDA
jgi:hypothetical protein